MKRLRNTPKLYRNWKIQLVALLKVKAAREQDSSMLQLILENSLGKPKQKEWATGSEARHVINLLRLTGKFEEIMDSKVLGTIPRELCISTALLTFLLLTTKGLLWCQITVKSACFIYNLFASQVNLYQKRHKKEVTICILLEVSNLISD